MSCPLECDCSSGAFIVNVASLLQHRGSTMAAKKKAKKKVKKKAKKAGKKK